MVQTLMYLEVSMANMFVLNRIQLDNRENRIAVRKEREREMNQ